MCWRIIIIIIIIMAEWQLFNVAGYLMVISVILLRTPCPHSTQASDLIYCSRQTQCLPFRMLYNIPSYKINNIS